jgi:PBP1b-binding outer membrane lipoprotein LpoB
MKSKLLLSVILCESVLLIGCAAPASRPVTYEDVNSAGTVAGVGIESQDIVGVTDRMVRDILANPTLTQRATPPRVVMDAEYFKNESAQPINKSLMTDRLRINLQRAAQGRLMFVSRESAGMVAKERDLKRDGLTDSGTTGLTHAQAGVDYRLTGRINSLDTRSKSSGQVERYTQISFELIDMESSVSVWSDIYEFKKGGLDDAIYR